MTKTIHEIVIPRDETLVVPVFNGVTPFSSPLQNGDLEMQPRPSLQTGPSITETFETKRGNWGNKWQFLLSCVGLSVGIGNVWRFPYRAYQNGGGAFLIPYLIMLALAGKPLYFMELALGQFGGSGCLNIWRLSPIFKGVGAAMILCSSVVVIYYNVIMSYALYFIGQSFSSVLPWTTCDPSWASSVNCTVRNDNTSFATGSKPSAEVFWERKVLNITSGIEDLGGIKWDLAGTLLLSWVIVIACLVKGVKTSGKVVYFAATFPYVILLTLLIAGLTQTGAWTGIKYFLSPDWTKLTSIQVWQEAASQMFFSLTVAMGGLIMYSSYNDFRHNVFRDAMVVSILDTVTSIISGIVIFSILGAMSHELGIDIDKVVTGGPGLAFVAFPEALSRLPCPQLWSVLFFLMLYILGLDSQFAVVENIITSLSDEIKVMRRHRLKFTIGFGCILFLCGLTCVTRGGQYVINLLDSHGADIPLVVIAVFECVGVMWFYGFDNFAFDVCYMLERKLGWYWKITWQFTSPIILGSLFVAFLVTYKPLSYGPYDYPLWANIFGWGLTLVILLQIPGWAIYAIAKERKGKSLIQRMKSAAAEADDWGPRDKPIRRDWRMKKTALSGTNILPNSTDQFSSRL